MLIGREDNTDLGMSEKPNNCASKPLERLTRPGLIELSVLEGYFRL